MKQLVVIVNKDGTIDAYWRTEDGDDHVTYDLAKIEHVVGLRPARKGLMARAAKVMSLLVGTIQG